MKYIVFWFLLTGLSPNYVCSFFSIFVFPGAISKALFNEKVLSQHTLFDCPVTEWINADPGFATLFTTELGNASGERHGVNCIQSESNFLLSCDELNTGREVGHAIMVCESRNRVTDVENKLMVTKGERGAAGWIGRLGLTYIHYYV